MKKLFFTEFLRMEVKRNMKARTVCCGVLADTTKAPIAKTETGEEYLVCNEQCRKVVSTMTPEQLQEISKTNLE
jgi:hypothetical protein